MTPEFVSIAHLKEKRRDENKNRKYPGYAWLLPAALINPSQTLLLHHCFSLPGSRKMPKKGFFP
jgi:hypothetical protein